MIKISILITFTYNNFLIYFLKELSKSSFANSITNFTLNRYVGISN